MSNKSRQGSAPKPSGSKSMPPKSEVDKPNNGKGEVVSLTRADLDNMMEKVQETATRIAQDAVRKQVALSAPASDKKHRFGIYEEVVFFNELLLGNFWTFPLGRALIIVKLTLEDDDKPTYSIRDRDVNHIIDGVDQCFLSTEKEFWAWKDDYESRNPDYPRDFARNEEVEYRNYSGVYNVDGFEKNTSQLTAETTSGYDDENC